MAVLRDRLGADLKEAMRSGDTVRRDEIRGLMAALQAERGNKLSRTLEKQGLILRGDEELTADQLVEVERIRAESDLDDAEELAVLQQRVKQHRQSIDAFEAGHRADLVAVEQAQLDALQAYLPRQVTPGELEQAIQAAVAEAGASTPRDQGKVMGLLSQRLRGRADMKLVSSRVQALLAGSA
jgi:uncharacterized protein YqeY